MHDAVVGQRGVPRQEVDVVAMQSVVVVGRIVDRLIVALGRADRDALDLML